MGPALEANLLHRGDSADTPVVGGHEEFKGSDKVADVCSGMRWMQHADVPNLTQSVACVDEVLKGMDEAQEVGWERLKAGCPTHHGPEDVHRDDVATLLVPQTPSIAREHKREHVLIGLVGTTVGDAQIPTLALGRNAGAVVVER